MQGTLSKWLMAMAALGAGYLVLTNAGQFYKLSQGVKNIVGGTETQIVTGGKAG